MTITLGGDSFFHKKNTLTSFLALGRVAATPRSREVVTATITDGTSIGDLPVEIQTKLVCQYISSRIFFCALFLFIRSSVFILFFTNRSSDRKENYRRLVFPHTFFVYNVVGKMYTDG